MFSFFLWRIISLSCDEDIQMNLPMQQFDFDVNSAKKVCISVNSKSAFFIFNKWDGTNIEIYCSKDENSNLVKFNQPSLPENVVGFSFGNKFNGKLVFSSESITPIPVSVTGNMLYTQSASLYITNSEKVTWSFPNRCQKNGDGKYYRYFLNMGSNDAEYKIKTNLKQGDFLEITDGNNEIVEKVVSSTEKTITTTKANPNQFLFYSEDKETSSSPSIAISNSMKPDIDISGCFSPSGPKWIMNTSFIDNSISVNDNDVKENEDNDLVYVLIGILCGLIFVGFVVVGIFYHFLHKRTENLESKPPTQTT